MVKFNIHKIKNAHASMTLVEIPIGQLRRDEIILDELQKLDDDLVITLEEIFDDEWNTPRWTGVETCYYLKLVKTKKNAPKGAGSSLIATTLTTLNTGSIVCLYAYPIHPVKTLSYSDEELSQFLPKLKKVYSNIGFESVTDHIMVAKL